MKMNSGGRKINGALVHTEIARTFNQVAVKRIVVAVVAAIPAVVCAGEFEMDNGLKGSWSINASIGTTIRAAKQDPFLYGITNGRNDAAGNVPGRAATGTVDDGNLNFRRGEAVSSPLKVMGEVEIKDKDWGVFLRGKAWYDFTLNEKGVPHGNFGNGHEPGAKLSEAGFNSLSKFQGVALLDAFVYKDLNLGNNKNLSVRLGNQVLNWGESQFISGINSFNPIDVAAARRPGATVKETLIPFPLVSANLGFGQGVSVEAFYQLKWEPTQLDGCGTFYSIGDPICSAVVAAPFNQGISDREGFTGILRGPFTGFTAIVDRQPDKKPRNGGQFGIAIHKVFPELNDTDVGLYFVRYNQRIPVNTWTNIPSRAGSIYSGVLPAQAPMSYQLDYSAEGIKILGLSASTLVGGAAITAELTYHKDVPVGVNPTDLGQFASSRGTQGPLVGHRTYGDYMRGYDQLAKTQFQFGASQLFNQVLGADGLIVAGEAGFQWWQGIPDPKTGVRYGGAATYLGSPVASYTAGPLSSLAACKGALSAGGADPTMCEYDAYATKFAWGYRLVAQLSYLNALNGWDFNPRAAWAHDVTGFSGDNTFLQGRKMLGIGASFSRRFGQYRTTVDVAYTAFPNPTKWDPTHDRDNLGVSLSVAF